MLPNFCHCRKVALPQLLLRLTMLISNMFQKISHTTSATEWEYKGSRRAKSTNSPNLQNSCNLVVFLQLWNSYNTCQKDTSHHLWPLSPCSYDMAFFFHSLQRMDLVFRLTELHGYYSNHPFILILTGTVELSGSLSSYLGSLMLGNLYPVEHITLYAVEIQATPWKRGDCWKGLRPLKK